MITDDNKTTLSKIRFEKAEKALNEAQLTLDAGAYDSSVHKSYYTILHCIRAVLVLDGFDSKNHGQVIGRFNREYVKSGVFAEDTHKLISRAYRYRERSDYEDEFEADAEVAQQQLRDAVLFHNQTKEYLKTRY